MKITGPLGFWRFPIMSNLLMLDEEGGYHECWKCGTPFKTTQALYCEKCGTYICPNCGTHYCTLSEEAKKALDREMRAYGIWGSLRKKKVKRLEFPSASSYLEWLRKVYPDIYSSYEKGIMSLSDTMAEVYRRTDRIVLVG